MQAIRKILRVKNNQLQIELPENFFSGLVEVIILPLKDKEEKSTIDNQTPKGNQINEFQKLLLSGPVMTDKELQFFKEKKIHFNEWK